MERKALGELVEGGVLLTSRALDSGWPRRSLGRALRDGGWVRLRAGAWGEPGQEPGNLTRLRAVQILKPRLVVSHGSAAALWLIEMLGDTADRPMEFIDPGLTLRREPGEGVRVHRMPLGEAEVRERRGLRVTSPARTLADLLRAGPRDDAVVAVDSALAYRRVAGLRRAPLVRRDAIAAALDAPARGGSRARAWLRLCDPGAGSPAETVARLRMHDAGLRPESQVELVTGSGRRVRLDFLFRREGLAVEVEGYAYHGSRDAHRRDVARFNEVLRCPGVRNVLRVTAQDVFHRPTWMIREIRAALADASARQAQGGGQGPTSRPRH